MTGLRAGARRYMPACVRSWTYRRVRTWTELRTRMQRCAGRRPFGETVPADSHRCRVPRRPTVSVPSFRWIAPDLRYSLPSLIKAEQIPIFLCLTSCREW